MNKVALILGLLAVGVLVAIACVIAYQAGSRQGVHRASAEEAGNVPVVSDDEKTSLGIVCDVSVSIPVAGVDSARNVTTQIVIGGFDFSSRSGWYQGQFGISETRKGALTTEKNLLKVQRPAMFQRFGAMVANEEFTLDRSTGEFHQSLTFQDGRKLEVVKGYCGKFIKAPF